MLFIFKSIFNNQKNKNDDAHLFNGYNVAPIQKSKFLNSITISLNDLKYTSYDEWCVLRGLYHEHTRLYNSDKGITVGIKLLTRDLATISIISFCNQVVYNNGWTEQATNKVKIFIEEEIENIVGRIKVESIPKRNDFCNHNLDDMVDELTRKCKK